MSNFCVRRAPRLLVSRHLLHAAAMATHQLTFGASDPSWGARHAACCKHFSVLYFPGLVLKRNQFL